MRFVLIFFLMIQCTLHAEGLDDFCTSKKGQLVESYECPKTNFPLLTKVCLYKNEYEQLHFTDGCTGPTGSHRNLFLKSCIRHDLCYHHEPATNGKSQKQCDEQFLMNLMQDCQDSQNLNRCERWAKTMYQTLRVFGSMAYRCENTAVISY